MRTRRRPEHRDWSAAAALHAMINARRRHFVDARNPRVIVVMHAYDATKTLKRTYNDLPPDVVDHVILVDDVSQDETVDGFAAWPEGSRSRPEQRLRRQPEDVLPGSTARRRRTWWSCCIPTASTTRGWCQYDRRNLEGRADLVLARAFSTAPLAGGMPIWKYISNRFLTITENVVLRPHLSECHTLRAYGAAGCWKRLHSCSTPTSWFSTLRSSRRPWRLASRSPIPVPTRYFAEASSVNFRRRRGLRFRHAIDDGPLPAGSLGHPPVAVPRNLSRRDKQIMMRRPLPGRPGERQLGAASPAPGV